MALQYDPTGKVCSGGPQPGAVALAQWLLFFNPYDPTTGNGIKYYGIYNCRPKRGSKTQLSDHAEGRGVDIHIDIDPATGMGREWGAHLCFILVNKADELGIQEVIYNNNVWNVKKPYWHRFSKDLKAGATYLHYDHIHVGMNWWGAKMMTGELITKIMFG